MKHQLQLLFLLIATSAFWGCGVMHISYPRVNPPLIDIAAFDAPTLVMYRFDTGKWDFNQKKKIEVYRDAFRAFDEAFRESLEKLPQFDATYDTALHVIQWFSPEHKVAIDSKWIRDMAQDQKYQFYILVNQFNLYRNQETETYENDDGSKSKTAYYSLDAEAWIDIWDRTGTLLDESALHESVLIDERSVLSGLLAVGPAVGNYGEEASEISHALGFNYYQRFFPQEEMVSNYYYIDKELEAIQPLMQTGEWQVAREKLLQLYPVANTKMKRHIAHNLAIIHEILGDPEAAAMWWERSF